MTASPSASSTTDRIEKQITLRAPIERVEPPRLLSFRWHPGATDPSVDYEQEATTLVTFELTEIEGGTRLTLTESGFDALPESRRALAFRGNDDGWTAQMHDIERHVARAQ